MYRRGQVETVSFRYLYPVSLTLTLAGLGEIDIIEGVNDVSPNTISLHTTATCTIPSTLAGASGYVADAAPLTAFLTSLFSRVTNTDCNWQANGNTGCSFVASNSKSYGPSFNSAGGGWSVASRIDTALSLKQRAGMPWKEHHNSSRSGSGQGKMEHRQTSRLSGRAKSIRALGVHLSHGSPIQVVIFHPILVLTISSSTSHSVSPFAMSTAC